jgi:glutamate dehydrogenase
MESEPNFGRFLRATVEATDAEDLRPYPPEALESILRRSFEQLGKRGPGTHRIISHPAEIAEGPEIIEIFSSDMPFIVDSVLAAVRAAGADIRLMAHPILHFDPATFRVLEAAAAGSRQESFLHLHINPLPDEATRAALLAELDAVLRDVVRVVGGWRPMLDRLRQVVQEWHDVPPKVQPPILAEAMHFLGWLAEHNFTFLGMRRYRLEGEGAAMRLLPVEDSGLGILENPDVKFLRTGPDYVEMTAQHVAFLAEPEPLLVTKANMRARVHSRAHMDYIGIKLYDELGAVCGELRVLGLFTSASMAEPHSEVPLIRRKLSEVLRRADLPPQSHARKALTNALDHYPRAELFQISTDQLFEFATTIATLTDRPRVRVLSRIDRFDNFVSVLLFMPRDRYDSAVRIRVGEYLAGVYEGRVSAYYPSFPEGDLVRVHFIIGRIGGPTPQPPRDLLEREVTELTLTFADRLRRAANDPRAIAPWKNAFSPAYQAAVPPEAALEDIGIIGRLGDAAIALKLAPRIGGDGEDAGDVTLRVYHHRTPIPLSDRVPMLENFGFRVTSERTYVVTPEGGAETYIHDMVLVPPVGLDVTGDQALRVEEAATAVWRGAAESDGLNRLTASAGLGWTDVEILRALTKYLRQVGIAYSRSYLTTVLAGRPEVAAALVTLFHARHRPDFAGDRDAAIAAAGAAIATALDATTSLDEDRIIRRYRNLIEAALRTSAYQRTADGSRLPALAIKFDPALIDELPRPVPYREVFVYSPRLEGLHLRFGAIARGGLRWSDRPEDFRTEVLGLVKAQQVKNAIIVPVGAKGAFVPKRMPAGADRETVQREGEACYKIFVSSLLDVTDNLDGDAVVPPPDLRRHDADDPYLVVAADKGTARFSDTANAIALDRGYWLGDAFASGGSVGYDHKEMGITARGGWEAVKRHFRELDRDIQTQPFTAVGVGDMSGDVFGNGMLLSPQTRLIAAFDHRDIFIDPDPDPAVSLAERARLFKLPRSSWQDYNRELLSRGGGVYSRNLKNVALFAEARRALGLGSEPVTPDQVITAILRAEVDLLWFGGIGTYVKASDETSLDVGDKANDAIRITGSAVRAKVVGEGANLAVTQRGRVEYALRGGRINTDAIDNSAGVNSSDLEVNIKIALGTEVRAGRLTEQVRNDFLASMTEEVAALCLRNNYLQTLAISIAAHRGPAAFPDHLSLIGALERRGLLQRTLEFLPPDTELLERAAAGRGLTRPELAVLLAYAKLAAYADLLETAVPDDPYLGRELYRYFPPRLVETFGDAVEGHRLRREVIATVLSNAMINRGGPAFLNELMTATSADAGEVAAAYAAARDAFGLPDYHSEIDALDGEIAGETQLRLYTQVQVLLTRETLWFLRNESLESGLQPLVERYQAGVAEIRSLLTTLAPPSLTQAIAERAADFEFGGAPRRIARRIAELPALSFASDIVLVAERCGTGTAATAGAFFGVLETFGLARIIDAGSAIILADRFDRMALDRALANLLRAQRDLTADVLASGSGESGERLAAWRAARPEAVERVVAAVQSLTEGEMTVSRLSVAAGLLADLARSA